MSTADRANSRRRRPRRRGSGGGAAKPATSAAAPAATTPGAGKTGSPKSGSPKNSTAKTTTAKAGTAKGGGTKGGGAKSGGPKGGKQPRMRTVRETSAGGLVVDGLDGPREQRCAALIGRTDRRGRLLWSLPKGHIEDGETAEQTAVREVAEETGINGMVVAELGSIDYWFVTDGRRVHKTVHHYLMRSVGGELSDADVEVTQVEWVPLSQLDSKLAYADERRLAEVANRLIDRMENGRR
ncbi:NUDIX hydrolase [Nocardia sp. alder85J]|uniref:NUDIX hydrolase n=1 Tax=Nocardia sp. alder85J TaxID=2862949 RepID=UPI001CD6FF94|nr:NUDIX hydrolase [Nocardia sp. alder85J]MCX4096509.1 NUDIX hydrolase [Nocardia sp. alder85J]